MLQCDVLKKVNALIIGGAKDFPEKDGGQPLS